MEESLKEMCEYLARCEKWMSECPLSGHRHNDALFETYNNCMEEVMEKTAKLAEQHPDLVVRESILTMINEGEYPDELNSYEAWEIVARLIGEAK